MQKHFYVLILITAFVLPVYSAHGSEGQAASINAPALPEIKPVPRTGIAFEAYRKTIDDLFYIALSTNKDPEFGIHAIIVGLNEKLKENPNDQNSLVFLGHVYRILNQPAEANKFFQKAIALGQDDLHLHAFSGMMLLQVDNYEEALQKFKASSEQNPNDPDVWHALGRLQLHLQKFDDAIASYQKALELKPDSKEAALMLSVLYQKKKQYDDAIRVLEQSVKLNPHDNVAKYYLGVIYLDMQQMDKALGQWEPLYYDGVREPQFLFNLSTAYVEAKQPEKSKKILEHLQFFYPNSPDLLFLTAQSYHQMNRLNDAERSYREVIAEDPKYMSAYVGLAQVLEDLGKEKDRQKVLKQVSERFSQSPKPSTKLKVPEV